ncbi:HET-domain-containing protein [Microthyrium microscopicum]|uniref:HET-domain-containing protein n=1 Tax=Microthyrium microscopicum TaxID=703497 RepID=A0A6A6UNJ7_9PEZI|nr:HET-domain-containing protein [Microthyrium microscopicum]
MRLLSFKANGDIAWNEFINPDHIPSYAILSHTWDADEATYRDLVDGSIQAKKGYEKVRFCGEQAKEDGLDYFWVDTCCIDKSSSAELSEAINSMFSWYRNASRCYVRLMDVWGPSDPSDDWVAVAEKSTAIGSIQETLPQKWKEDFCRAKWFTRGWTLQELIAPRSVSFFSHDKHLLGDKGSLEDLINEITGVPQSVLNGSALSTWAVTERLSWAANRQTTRIEDGAYCLLGIFDIVMPLIYDLSRL